MVEKNRKVVESDVGGDPHFDTIFNDWELDPELSSHWKQLECSFQGVVLPSQQQMIHLSDVNSMHPMSEHLHGGCGWFAGLETNLFEGGSCSASNSICVMNITSDHKIASMPQTQHGVAAFVLATVPCIGFRTFFNQDFLVFNREWNIASSPHWIGFNDDCVAGHIVLIAVGMMMLQVIFEKVHVYFSSFVVFASDKLCGT